MREHQQVDFKRRYLRCFKEVQRIQKEIENATGEATGWIAEKQDEINTKLNLASATVSSIMRTIYDDVMGVVLDEFNKATALISEFLTPKPNKSRRIAEKSC